MSEPLELEGTWEEIVAHSAELAGRRVRLVILPDAPDPESSEALKILNPSLHFFSCEDFINQDQTTDDFSNRADIFLTKCNTVVFCCLTSNPKEIRIMSNNHSSLLISKS